MATAETLADMFELLRANWPKHPFTDGTTEVYTQGLKDIPDRILKAATVHCITTRTFWPVVAELRQAAFEIMCNRAGLLTAGEAWTLVDKRVRTGPIRFDGERMITKPPLSELIERTVASVGGWDWLGNSDNYVADRAKFRDNYNDFIEKGRDMVQMLPEVRELAKALAMDRPQLEG